MRVVGVEVACGDDERRFLPLAAARLRDDELAVGSALLLLEGDDLGFYRRRGRLLSALRGRTVTLAGRPTGVLRDLVLTPDGVVVALEVETPTAARARVRVDADVQIADAPASAA
jgi:hypothetical protein